jgi:hypothetical protein
MEPSRRQHPCKSSLNILNKVVVEEDNRLRIEYRHHNNKPTSL